MSNIEKKTRKSSYNKDAKGARIKSPEDYLFERVPPHSMEAESAVLSGVFLRPELLNDVLDILNADDFYVPANRAVFQAFTALYGTGVAVDTVITFDWLESHKLLEEAGGAERLAQLQQAFVSGANAPYYAKIVQEKSLLRTLIASSARIIGRCFDNTSDIPLLLDEAEKDIFAVTERNEVKSYSSSSQLLDTVWRQLQERYDNKGRMTGLRTGYHQLDAMTGGLQPTDLIIIAARPSMGKTAFALNIATRCALNNDTTVVVFSLEMSKEKLMERLLSAWGRVELGNISKGTLSQEDWDNLTLASKQLRECKLIIDDSSALTPLELRARCRRIKAEQGLGLVVVDYLQLMHSARNDSRELEISDISRNLKALAKELRVPVIALSQLNRKTEEGDKRPMLSNLRESGAIEQDADIIMFIHREDYYTKNSKGNEMKPKTNKAEIIIGKHRNGPTGTIELAFVDKYTAFENLERYVSTEDIPV